ncbi:hypothetical protein [Pseudolactococcus hodotermopsidis]|uniref:hypothetical protein n=1 Tax=Pseudolactococcus hodotermopsidis TaxID=2709157 RepID=UPI00155368E2|nr:hypothetical protein [Lactococcus hodotermopsidis]
MIDAETKTCDAAFFLDLIAHSPARKLSLDEKMAIIESCQAAAISQFENLIELSPLSHIKNLGFKLVEDVAMENVPVFALCHSAEKKLTLNAKMIEKVEQRLQNFAKRDEKWAVNIKIVVLWHELFHMLEENDPTIYTRNAWIEKKFFNRVKKVPLECASEIGAIYFSKIATNLPFNPRVFELLA